MYSLNNKKSKLLYILFTVFAIVFIISFATTLALNESPSKINCVLYISVEGKNFVTECGGVPIGGGTVLTVAHPFKNINSYDDIEISAYDKNDGNTYALTLIKTDFVKDLALLSCKCTTYPNIKISKYAHIYRTLFFPSGKEFEYINKCTSSGTINMNGRNLLTLNCTVKNGFSGYPIISNSNTLIGIICSTDYINNTSYAICGPTIKDFIYDALPELKQKTT